MVLSYQNAEKHRKIDRQKLLVLLIKYIGSHFYMCRATYIRTSANVVLVITYIARTCTAVSIIFVLAGGSHSVPE